MRLEISCSQRAPGCWENPCSCSETNCGPRGKPCSEMGKRSRRKKCTETGHRSRRIGCSENRDIFRGEPCPETLGDLQRKPCSEISVVSLRKHCSETEQTYRRSICLKKGHKSQRRPCSETDKTYQREPCTEIGLSYSRNGQRSRRKSCSQVRCQQNKEHTKRCRSEPRCAGNQHLIASPSSPSQGSPWLQWIRSRIFNKTPEQTCQPTCQPLCQPLCQSTCQPLCQSTYQARSQISSLSTSQAARQASHGTSRKRSFNPASTPSSKPSIIQSSKPSGTLSSQQSSQPSSKPRGKPAIKVSKPSASKLSSNSSSEPSSKPLSKPSSKQPSPPSSSSQSSSQPSSQESLTKSQFYAKPIYPPSRPKTENTNTGERHKQIISENEVEVLPPPNRTPRASLGRELTSENRTFPSTKSSPSTPNKVSDDDHGKSYEENRIRKPNVTKSLTNVLKSIPNAPTYNQRTTRSNSTFSAEMTKFANAERHFSPLSSNTSINAGYEVDYERYSTKNSLRNNGSYSDRDISYHRKYTEKQDRKHSTDLLNGKERYADLYDNKLQRRKQVKTVPESIRKHEKSVHYLTQKTHPQSAYGNRSSSSESSLFYTADELDMTNCNHSIKFGRRAKRRVIWKPPCGRSNHRSTEYKVNKDRQSCPNSHRTNSISKSSSAIIRNQKTIYYDKPFHDKSSYKTSSTQRHRPPPTFRNHRDDNIPRGEPLQDARINRQHTNRVSKGPSPLFHYQRDDNKQPDQTVKDKRIYRHSLHLVSKSPPPMFRNQRDDDTKHRDQPVKDKHFHRHNYCNRVSKSVSPMLRNQRNDNIHRGKPLADKPIYNPNLNRFSKSVSPLYSHNQKDKSTIIPSGNPPKDTRTHRHDLNCLSKNSLYLPRNQRIDNEPRDTPLNNQIKRSESWQNSHEPKRVSKSSSYLCLANNNKRKETPRGGAREIQHGDMSRDVPLIRKNRFYLIPVSKSFQHPGVRVVNQRFDIREQLVRQSNDHLGCSCEENRKQIQTVKHQLSNGKQRIERTRSCCYGDDISNRVESSPEQREYYANYSEDVGSSSEEYK